MNIIRSIRYRFLSGLLALVTAPFVTATEVDGKMFVVDPVAVPSITTKTSRIWPCVGFVNSQLLGIIYDELKILSDSEKLTRPDASLCDYKIGTLALFGKPMTLYTFEYYVSSQHRRSCLFNNYCDDTRSITFKVRDGVLHRQYMLTNVARKLTRFSCISMKGAVVDMNGGC